MATKAQFLAEYEKALKARHIWALNAERFPVFMASVRRTLDGGSEWNHDGEASLQAWRAIGGKGKPTLRGLRALAD